MPYAMLEKDIQDLTTSQQDAVAMFVRFLLTQKQPRRDTVAPRPRRRRVLHRSLGGFEDGFSMSPDFDAPLPEFADYT